MTFEEAFRASIRSYYNGEGLKEYAKAKGSLKFTKDYFDKLDADLMPEEKGSKNAK